MDFTRLARNVPREPDPHGEIPQSVHPTMGRRDRRHSLLGAENGRRKVSNLRHQLHSSWVSGALVSGVAPVHVSVSRRRFLRRRLPRIRAAAAGLYEYKYKIEDGQLWIHGGQLPTLNQPA